MKEEKVIYRILGQKDGVTITAQTSDELTYDEAKSIAKNSILGFAHKVEQLDPVIILPLTTKERWKEGSINFCPRCGKNITDFDLSEQGNFECSACDAEVYVHITPIPEDEDE